MTEDNWQVCGREGLLGLGRDAERRPNRMADGDRVWVYLNRKYVDRQVPKVREVQAVARINGGVRRLVRSLWKARGQQHFEYARPIIVEHRCGFPALDLLKTMSFAGRPPTWGLRLLNAPVPLTEDDVRKLEGALSP